MRLRQTGVPESTIAGILWHRRHSMTLHYAVAQVVEIHATLEKIKGPNGMRVPQSPRAKKNSLGACASKLLF